MEGGICMEVWYRLDFVLCLDNGYRVIQMINEITSSEEGLID